MSGQQQAQQPQTAPQSGPDAPPWWIGLVTDRLDAKLDALKSYLEGEIKAAESRLEGKIQAAETRQSEARASQTWRIIAAMIGIQGVFLAILQIWPPGGGG